MDGQNSNEVTKVLEAATPPARALATNDDVVELRERVERLEKSIVILSGNEERTTRLHAMMERCLSMAENMIGEPEPDAPPAVALAAVRADAPACPKHPDAPQTANGCTAKGCTYSP